MKFRILILIGMISILAAILSSCGDTVIEPIRDNEGMYNAAMILHEGLWSQNNASISIYVFDKDLLVNDYFRKANPGLELGDTANDIIVRDTIAYIIANGSHSIIKLNPHTGKFIAKLTLEGKPSPRCGAFLNDSMICVTNLNDDSFSVIDVRSMEEVRRVPTGPNPEGIVVARNRIYVCNSGLGALGKDKPDAGTIFMYFAPNFTLLDKVFVGPNVTEIIHIPGAFEKLFACYYNTYEPDSVGGIVRLGMELEIENTWHVQATDITEDNYGNVCFIRQDAPGSQSQAQSSISSVRVKGNALDIRDHIKNDKSGEFWYGLGIHPVTRAVYIANAKDFQSTGELLIYKNIDAELPEKVMEIGLNPNKIVFLAGNK